jgi:hypothetical protein
VGTVARVEAVASVEAVAGLVVLVVAVAVAETVREVLVRAVAVEAGVAREGCTGVALLVNSVVVRMVVEVAV